MNRNSAVIVPEPRISNVPEIIAALRRWFDEGEIRETILPFTAQDKQRPSKEWKTDDGFVILRYHGLSRFSLEHTVNTHKKGLAQRMPSRYSSGKATSMRRRKEMTMPARGRRQAAAPEPEPQNGEVDFTTYLDKPFSPTMTGYIQWFEDNVSSLDDLEVDRILVLGSQMYTWYQKSDFNIQRREAARAARQAPAEPEEQTAPARGRRGAGKAPASKAPASKAPAAKGRGRQRAAASTSEAPY